MHAKSFKFNLTFGPFIEILLALLEMFTLLKSLLTCPVISSTVVKRKAQQQQIELLIATARIKWLIYCDIIKMFTQFIRQLSKQLISNTFQCFYFIKFLIEMKKFILLPFFLVFVIHLLSVFSRCFWQFINAIVEINL